jgi:hypothetical protein
MTVRFLCAGLLIIAFAGPLPAQGKGKPAPAPPPPSETTALLKLLEERIEMKDLLNDTQLPEILQLVQEKLEARGKAFPYLINAAAFRAEGMDPEQVGLRVQLSKAPKQQTLQALLDQATAQIQATYLLRKGHVEVVPAEYATIDNLLTQRILARYDQTPVRDVLQDLADQTGATIVLDARAGDAAKEVISATLRNNATLEDVLRMCTEAAGLKFVVLRNSVYVTTPANARAIQQEQNDTPRPGRRDPPA